MWANELQQQWVTLAVGALPFFESTQLIPLYHCHETAKFVASQDGTDSSLFISMCIRSKNSMTAIASRPKSTTSRQNVSLPPIAVTELARVQRLAMTNPPRF